MNPETIDQGKTTAIIAYLTVIGTIIGIFMNMEPKNEYARFHLRQAFGIFLTYFVLAVLVPFFDSWAVSGAFYIFIIVLWGFGLINAFQGVTKPIPLVGEKFQQWFTFIE